MVGNKQGEWGNEIEKHSKQRGNSMQRSFGKKHAKLLNTAVIGEQRIKMAQNVAIVLHRSQINHEWSPRLGF